MSAEPTVEYHGKHYAVKPGEDLLSQLLISGADIQYLCMGGTCGTCRVCVVSGAEHLEPITPGERHFIVKGSCDRLACQAIFRGTGNVVIEQPISKAAPPKPKLKPKPKPSKPAAPPKS